MATICKIPLLLVPQEEGGYTVTSPVIPELLTEGDTLEEALRNVNDAFKAVKELYEDLGKQLPSNLFQGSQSNPIVMESLIEMET